jgi:phosphoserine phosphatase RsbU/P
MTDNTDNMISLDFARRVMDSFPFAVMVVNHTGIIQYVNKAYREFFECSVDELVARNIAEMELKLVPWNSAAEIPLFLARNSDWSGETKYITRNGEQRWYSQKFIPSHGDSGSIESFILTIIDITERKMNEEAAIKKESRFRSILHNINEYIYSVEYDNGQPAKTYHSPRCVDVTGYTYREFEQNNGLWFSMIHPDDRERAAEFLSGIGTQQQSSYIEHRIIDKKNRERWVSNTYALHRDIDGKILRMDGFIQDITSRRTLMDQLRKLSLAVEQSPASVVVTDKNGAIEYVNPKFTQLTGYSMSEAGGKNPRILKSEDMSSDVYKLLWDTILAGNEWRGEFHNKKKDGSLYWESASISPLRNVRGEVTHFIAVKEDITARKEAEEALRIRTEMMEQDLRYAQTVQLALLPSSPPASDIVNVVYRFLPLDRVGGDFFTFTSFDGSTGIFVGDIAGHGVPAALFLSLIKFATEDISKKDGGNPSVFLSRLNMALCQNMTNYFITAVYGLFKKDNGNIRFSFANGAHPPLVLQKCGAACELINVRGGILGAFDDMKYLQSDITLSAGDRVWFYTDGIQETKNRFNEIIGFDKMKAMIGRTVSLSIDEACDAILSEVTAFRGDIPMEDDIVLIVCEVK